MYGPANDEAPKDEAPKDEAPKDEAPKDEAPKDEAPKDEAPKDEAPKDEAPNDEAPNDEARRGVVQTNGGRKRGGVGVGGKGERWCRSRVRERGGVEGVVKWGYGAGGREGVQEKQESQVVSLFVKDTHEEDKNRQGVAHRQSDSRKRGHRRSEPT